MDQSNLSNHDLFVYFRSAGCVLLKRAVRKTFVVGSRTVLTILYVAGWMVRTTIMATVAMTRSLRDPWQPRCHVPRSRTALVMPAFHAALVAVHVILFAAGVV